MALMTNVRECPQLSKCVSHRANEAQAQRCATAVARTLRRHHLGPGVTHSLVGPDRLAPLQLRVRHHNLQSKLFHSMHVAVADSAAALHDNVGRHSYDHYGSRLPPTHRGAH